MTNLTLIRQNSKRPLCTVRKKFPPFTKSDLKYWKDNGYPIPTHKWECVCQGEVVDEYMTREEARSFANAFDPDGWWCKECDESRTVECGERWQCLKCGAWNG